MAREGQIDQVKSFVSVEISHSLERHFAATAGKWFVSDVASSVDAKLRCSLELLLTMAALVRLFTSMSSAVHDQLWCCFEAFFTIRAFEGFFPGMDSLMYHELWLSSVRLVALDASIWSFPGMNNPVLKQFGFKWKRLITLRTLVKLFYTSVSFVVSWKLGWSAKGQWTCSAIEGLLNGVSFCVGFKVVFCFKWLVTNCTFKKFDYAVTLLVFFVFRFSPEASFTVAAFVGLLPAVISFMNGEIGLPKETPVALGTSERPFTWSHLVV